jgi:uncharacterized protein involved in response to NO
MAELLRIDEPGPARALAPKWSAFLELGFRPLYLAGCFWAAVSVALWVFAPDLLRGQLVGMIWHAHEMLWGFIATIAVGFLLTAGSNWTGMNPLKGRALGALGLLWVLARVGYLVPGATAFWWAVGCELLFFAWAAAALGRAIYGARNQRNYGVPLLVLALGVADALFLLAAWQGDYALLMQRFNVGLLCMAVVALLVARRVIPFFAMRAVPGLAIPMHTRSGHWQLGASGLAIGFGLPGWRLAMAACLAAAGVLALVQVLAWKPWAVRRVPLLWILYLGYAALGVGLLVAAAHASGWVLRAAWPVHVIGVAGFSLLIIGMVTRTALGHLGRPLRTDRPIVWCYALMIAAAALRLLALLPSSLAHGALLASAGAWVLALGLYLWRFFPMLIRPGIDPATTPVLKPGQITVRRRAPS